MTPPDEPLYAWQTLDDDGRWGIVAAVIPGVGGGPLIARDLMAIDRLGLLAIAHHDRTGQRIRKVRYELTEVLREVP